MRYLIRIITILFYLTFTLIVKLLLNFIELIWYFKIKSYYKTNFLTYKDIQSGEFNYNFAESVVYLLIKK